MLLSGELYCRVCGLILHAEQAATLQNHQSVIQALSRKGIYVLQPDNTPVSELDLRSAPVKMVGARTLSVCSSLLIKTVKKKIAVDITQRKRSYVIQPRRSCSPEPNTSLSVVEEVMHHCVCTVEVFWSVVLKYS